MWFLLFLPLFAFAETDADLSAINDLENILPDNDIPKSTYRNIEFERKNRGFRPPNTIVTEEEILESGVGYAFIKKGTPLYRLSDNKAVTASRDFYLKAFLLHDEQGFAYIRNDEGGTTYKVSSTNLISVDKELELYEPPKHFKPAGNIVRTEYDRKLKLVPEAAFFAGLVQSQYIRDLFNDSKARTGNTNQYAFHYFTEWDLPIKVGGSLHYERASYNLTAGGLVYYESLSIGPQFRTKDFDLFETNWRLTTQIRVSPFAKLRGETVNGNVNFKFNSTDFMTTLEHPWSNRFGQFVIGGFFQMQWLNIKDAPEIVSVRASNEVNQSFGFFLSQVFQ
jgi:hypothetical protein